jgi:GNAT superfamily N-acetyltransferase
MSISVRRATAADADAVTGLVSRAYAHYVPRIGLRPAPMDDDHGGRIGAGQCWVAVDGATVVGVIELAEDGAALMVVNVAVDPDRQGEGLGGRLLDVAPEEARRLGLTRLRLYTHVLMVENQRYYRRRGWTLLERRTDYGVERFYYGKDLLD